ncbi:MAG TPA: hypothetical protein VK530_08495 [Candidatus Acidoferrum sp.]|nr:hypothetical protein [Candidatus Acidoferrum sp.]
MKTHQHKRSLALDLDDPIPYRVTAYGRLISRAWRWTKYLRILRPRHWRN